MKDISKKLLKEVAGLDELPKGAYNIREDSQTVARQSTENIKIVGKEDQSGIDIIVKAGTKAENVYIPALVSCGNVHDLVYNDFILAKMPILPLLLVVASIPAIVVMGQNTMASIVFS